jgi:sugar-phosphatase
MDLRDLAAVLLDMDGTLVDSDAAVERAWLTWGDEYGVDGATATVIGHGRPSEPTVRTMRPDLDDAGVAAAAQRQLELEYDDLDDVVATPGAHELLDLLARLGLPWAVVTSADTRLARARLGAAGIEPPVLVTVDDIAAGKPDPEGYLRAAELLGVPIGKCLVVEDAEAGVVAGRAAGARTAALRGLDADVSIRSLKDLSALIAGR